MQYLFSTVFVFAKWQFSFKSTVPLRAHFIEVEVYLLYLKTKCQSVREKDHVNDKQRIRPM